VLLSGQGRPLLRTRGPSLAVGVESRTTMSLGSLKGGDIPPISH
jgi:hypothetical protein